MAIWHWPCWPDNIGDTVTRLCTKGQSTTMIRNRQITSIQSITKFNLCYWGLIIMGGNLIQGNLTAIRQQYCKTMYNEKFFPNNKRVTCIKYQIQSTSCYWGTMTMGIIKLWGEQSINNKFQLVASLFFVYLFFCFECLLFQMNSACVCLFCDCFSCCTWLLLLLHLTASLAPCSVILVFWFFWLTLYSSLNPLVSCQWISMHTRPLVVVGGVW